jgi:hypothetical protein
MTTFKRGFKTWAERLSAEVRKDMGREPEDPIDPLQLAALLEIQVITPRNLDLPQEVLIQLLENDPWGWSAVSLELPSGKGLIIYNPRKSNARQASDIMHELAHTILNHQPATIILSPDGQLSMRTFDKKQEDEANWLAFCLLLPRPALLVSRSAGLTVEQIAERYGVSNVLVNFRLRMSGVAAQIRARQKYYSRSKIQ